jgi:4'-phosphopantetheinyl transferase
MAHPDSHRIDLWCTFCDAIDDAALLARYRGLLSEAECHQQDSFHFARDQHRYLVTRALVRTTLSQYADIAPELWTFTTSAHGRPAISNEDPRARTLSFNITHTDELVVLGVTHDRELGIDTEEYRNRRVALEIADRYFSAEEVADLYDQPPAGQPERFFRYWTLKESYIKARGLGLSIPLDQFSFRFSDRDCIRMSTSAQLNDAPSNWQFWQWSLASAHLLAVCARRLPGPSTLVLRQIIPLQSQSDMPSTLLGHTGSDA